MIIKCDIEKCLYCVGHICVDKDYKKCPYYQLQEMFFLLLKEREKEND